MLLHVGTTDLAPCGIQHTSNYACGCLSLSASTLSAWQQQQSLTALAKASHELDVLADHTHVQTHKAPISSQSQPLLQRQKAAKKHGPQPLDDEDDFLDEASDPAPPLHPPADPIQMAASQYPAGVPLPGQDPLSANRIAAFQAGVQQRSQDTPSMQGQAAAAQTKREKAAPQQAAPQEEVTQPAVAAHAGAKQGKKRGGKKQAQKVG